MPNNPVSRLPTEHTSYSASSLGPRGGVTKKPFSVDTVSPLANPLPPDLKYSDKLELSTYIDSNGVTRISLRGEGSATFTNPKTGMVVTLSANAKLSYDPKTGSTIIDGSAGGEVTIKTGTGDIKFSGRGVLTDKGKIVFEAKTVATIGKVKIEGGGTFDPSNRTITALSGKASIDVEKFNIAATIDLLNNKVIFEAGRTFDLGNGITLNGKVRYHNPLQVVQFQAEVKKALGNNTDLKVTATTNNGSDPALKVELNKIL